MITIPSYEQGETEYGAKMGANVFGVHLLLENSVQDSICV